MRTMVRPLRVEDALGKDASPKRLGLLVLGSRFRVKGEGFRGLGFPVWGGRQWGKFLNWAIRAFFHRNFGDSGLLARHTDAAQHARCRTSFWGAQWSSLKAWTGPPCCSASSCVS